MLAVTIKSIAHIATGNYIGRSHLNSPTVGKTRSWK